MRLSKAAIGALLMSTIVLGGGAAAASTTLDGTNCVVFDARVDGELARCVGYIGDHQTLSISLMGKAPNKVDHLDLSIDGKKPFQRLELNATPEIGAETVGVSFRDMNFDGHKDLAIMREVPDSSDLSFAYFLYVPSAKRFARDTYLEPLGNPQFDSKTRTVRARWREGAVLEGTDTYAWRNGRLVRILRDSEDRSGGQCRRRKLRFAETDEPKLLFEGPCAR